MSQSLCKSAPWSAPRFRVAGLGSSLLLALGLAASCGPGAGGNVAPQSAANQQKAGAPVRVRSFSDSLPVSTLASASGVLWVGTPHGLVRWSAPNAGAKDAQPTPSVLTTADGLPSDRITSLSIDGKGGVWVLTPKGVSTFADGGWTNFPSPPVGDLVVGLVAVGDGRVAWAAGSDGLARLREGQWEHFAPGTTVTTIAADGAGGIWAGTSGKGVLRVVGNDLLQFGSTEGNDIDNVRGMAAGDGGAVLIVGDSPSGPRAAYYDGSRFYSYRVEAPGVLEWVSRGGGELLLGSGHNVWSMKRITPTAKPTGAVRFTFVGNPVTESPKAQPLKAVETKADEGEAVKAAPAKAGPTEVKPPEAPKATPVKGKGKGGKKTGALLQVPAERLAQAAAPTTEEAAPRPVRPWLTAGPGGRAFDPPRFDTEPVGVRLPDGVTSVATDGNNLYVGTRFLGVMRINRTKETPFRLFDLTSGAERLSVACVSNDECYVATGGSRAWRFDGQSFEVTEVDPEKGSHVLAVVRDPAGAVLALHRGPTTKEVRISRVGAQGKWFPVGVTSLEVPLGVPDLSFATFSPRGRLWVGLRYTDREHDTIDFGAAAVNVDDGRVVYYRQRPKGASSSKVTEGPAIPSDVNAISFRGTGDEVWFSSKSGAVRLLDGKTEGKPVRVFTENDGLESELLHDIVEGLNGQIWVATSKGIGQWDGERWRFPKTNQLNRRASALARDSEGRIWVGGEQGVMEVVDENRRHFIGTRTGLLDDKVLNLTVDIRGRVWTLTEKGISIIEPL